MIKYNLNDKSSLYNIENYDQEFDTHDGADISDEVSNFVSAIGNRVYVF